MMCLNFDSEMGHFICTKGHTTKEMFGVLTPFFDWP